MESNQAPCMTATDTLTGEHFDPGAREFTKGGSVKGGLAIII